jgi:hypothetical protein
MHKMCPRMRQFAHSSSPLFFPFFLFVLWLCVRHGPQLWFSQHRPSPRAIMHRRRRWSWWQHVHGRVSLSCFQVCRGVVENKVLMVCGRVRVPLHSRVAICNYRGAAVLECYVVPTMAVTDYRTSTTGITPAHLSSGRSTHKKTMPLAILFSKGPFLFPTPGLTDSAELVLQKPML